MWSKLVDESPERIRRDGWSPERQLRFLRMLAKTRSVTTSARAVGMSRESAYRLRARLAGELFALTWDSIMGPRVTPPTQHEVYKSHIEAMCRACGPEGDNLRRALQQRQLRDLGSAEQQRPDQPQNRLLNVAPKVRGSPKLPAIRPVLPGPNTNCS